MRYLISVRFDLHSSVSKAPSACFYGFRRTPRGLLNQSSNGQVKLTLVQVLYHYKWLVALVKTKDLNSWTRERGRRPDEWPKRRVTEM